MYGIPWVISPYALWGLRLARFFEMGAIIVLGLGIVIALCILSQGRRRDS